MHTQHNQRLLHLLNSNLPRYFELDSESSVLKSNGMRPSKWLSLNEGNQKEDLVPYDGRNSMMKSHITGFWYCYTAAEFKSRLQKRLKAKSEQS